MAMTRTCSQLLPGISPSTGGSCFHHTVSPRERLTDMIILQRVQYDSGRIGYTSVSAYLERSFLTSIALGVNIIARLLLLRLVWLNGMLECRWRSLIPCWSRASAFPALSYIPVHLLNLPWTSGNQSCYSVINPALISALQSYV
ncbi:hypothetical protein BDV11DRAFT_29341 [Aspergillus similis]